MRYFSVCFFSLVLFVISTISVSAHSDVVFPKPTGGDINEALEKTVPTRFLPSHSLYFLITVKENFSRFFKPSSREKAEFDFVLMGKRLKESYLLLQIDDVEGASDGLKRYSDRSEIFRSQIKKAKGQNQNVADIAENVSNNAVFHETLIFAISDEFAMHQDAFNFDKNFEEAQNAFISMINVVDGIKPGIGNRYEIIQIRDREEKSKIIPTPTPAPTPFESTSSVRPRRILY